MSNTQLAREHTFPETSPNKAFIHEYLDAIDRGDLKRIRSMLADDGRFGRTAMSADEYMKSECFMLLLKGIRIEKEIYDGDDVALLYEGVDPTTGQPLEAHEFLTVTGGKISALRGVIVGGVLTGQGAASFSMSSVVAPI